MTLLSAEERARDLPALAAAGWQAVPGRDGIRKVWRFADFSSAWAFMSQIALLAERMDHHPEWSNRYNIVDVVLTTHDCAGLSALDIRMANALDALAGTTPVADHLGADTLTLCEQRHAARTSGA